MSAQQFMEMPFGKLPEFFKDEAQLRALWSEPETRKKLLHVSPRRDSAATNRPRCRRLRGKAKQMPSTFVAAWADSVSLPRSAGRRDRRRLLVARYTRPVQGAGGTKGGVGQFFLGVAMAAAGGWLLTNQVTVTSGYWSWGWLGGNSFGLSLLPLMAGIGLLFFDGKSLPGWLLTVTGASIILIGILMNLHIYFQPTSLFNTLMMLALLAGGLGLVARALRPYS